MVKHTQTIRRLFPTNSLSVFDHIVELALKRLNCIVMLIHEKYQRCFHNSVKHLRWNVLQKKWKLYAADFICKKLNLKFLAGL